MEQISLIHHKITEQKLIKQHIMSKQILSQMILADCNKIKVLKGQLGNIISISTKLYLIIM